MVNYVRAKRKISVNKWAAPRMAVTASGPGQPFLTIPTLMVGSSLIKRQLHVDVIKLVETKICLRVLNYTATLYH